jgi:hypothetical protein
VDHRHYGLSIYIDEVELYDSDDAVFDSDSDDDSDDDDTNECNIQSRAALGDRDLLVELLSKGQKRKAHTSSKPERNDPVSKVLNQSVAIPYICCCADMYHCSILLHVASASSL